MENIPNNNDSTQVNNTPVNGANHHIQRPAQPTQPVSQSAPQPNRNIPPLQANPQQRFYNNYSSQPGTIAYNTPSYTPPTQQTPYYRSTPTLNQQSPSSIYINAQNGNTPQYHYGNPTAGAIVNDGYLKAQEIKNQEAAKSNKTLRTLGNIAGLSILICLLRSTIMSSIVVFFPAIMGSMGALSLFNMFYQVLVIGGTFLVLHFILKGPEDKITKAKKYKSEIQLSLPKKPLKAFLLILIGFGGCMVANYVTSFVAWIFELLGIQSGYTSFENPNGLLETIVMFIGIAVIPPLIEEFSMRGVLLSSMQRYGNTFAIFATAFVFGLFHANFTQIPFAFLCGLFFAYTTIATKSLWPAIIIHALNNGLSCVANVVFIYRKEITKTLNEILLKTTNAFNTDTVIKIDAEKITDYFFYISSTIAIVLGICALIAYLKRYKKERILKDPGLISKYSSAKKFRIFMSAPAMIIATIIYFGEALIMLIFSSPLFEKFTEDLFFKMYG